MHFSADKYIQKRASDLGTNDSQVGATFEDDLPKTSFDSADFKFDKDRMPQWMMTSVSIGKFRE